MATMRMKVYALAAGLAAGVGAYAVWNSAVLQEVQPAVAQVAQEAKPAVAQEARPEVAQEPKPELVQVAQEAKPAAAPEPKPAQIDRNGVIILIRSSLIALDQANKTGNYTVLRDLGAPNFQATNTAAHPNASQPESGIFSRYR